MKKKINNTSSILIIFLILCYTFQGKIINIAPSLNISISLLLYPLTFILTLIIYQKHGILESKKSIILSVLLLFTYILISSLLCNISSISSENAVSESLRNVFTPQNTTLYNLHIYYPNILNTFLFIIVYTLSHYIFIVLYDGIKDNSNKYIGLILSLLIASILDQIMYLPITCIPTLLDKTITITELVKMLTANFIVIIFASVIILFISPIILRENEK